MDKKMKWLFLRGQVPQDRSPKEITSKTLETNWDMWTHLFYNLMGQHDYGEIWYWGSKRKRIYKENYVERWVPNFKKKRPRFRPDIIFCRGGFSEYDPILKAYPKAYKIYYGAGKRFIPQTYKRFNLILADSPAQLSKLKRKTKADCALWIKPAAPQFLPQDVKKKYDVCFIANGTQAEIKRIKWVYKTVPKGLKVLHLGNKSKYKPPKNVICKHVSRDKMPRLISMCKVGIVPYKKIDSAPRALVEMMACGLPIVAIEDVRIWEEKYFDVLDAYHVKKGHFWKYVGVLMEGGVNRGNWIPEHYEKHLSTKPAVEHLRCLIKAK